MLKPIILAQRGDKPLLASDSHRRCFDFRNKIIYCISTILACINIMKRSHVPLIFKKESAKSMLKSANTKIYVWILWKSSSQSTNHQPRLIYHSYCQYQSWYVIGMHIWDIASDIDAWKCDVFRVLTFYINESDRYVTSTCFWIYLLSFKTFHLFEIL